MIFCLAERKRKNEKERGDTSGSYPFPQKIEKERLKSMKIKKITSIIIAALLLTLSMSSVFASAATDKISGVMTEEEREELRFLFGSDEIFDEQARQIILESEVLTVADIKKMERTRDGKFAATWDNFDILKKELNAQNDKSAVNVSSSHDLTAIVPLPRTQGGLLSCVSWAVTYAALSAQEAKRRGWTPRQENHTFSPSYSYNSIVKGENEGTTIGETFRFVHNNGASTIKYFPISTTDCATQPNDTQKAAAALYKGNRWGYVSGVDKFKEEISKGNPIVISIYTHPDFKSISQSNPVFDVAQSSIIGLGRHAIALIGYDDSMGENGAFKFINSWGANWGLNGYGWISYDLISNIKVVIGGSGARFYGHYADDYIMGDVDENGSVTVDDSRAVMRYSVNSETPTARQYVLSDVNGDGAVTVDDARAILRFSTGNDAKLPIYD